MAKDFPSAVKAFARAIELNPNLPSLQSFYGMALLATGDADAAAQAFRNELAANPNDYDGNFQLASILAHRGRNRVAAELWLLLSGPRAYLWTVRNCPNGPHRCADSA